ncbi:MAG TPA: hypothetical protein P5090_05690 [Caldisericia bacterium]|nr:hypothetical protein [Caldisericia bacterium]HRT37742.1 hypothetical protein [Caldisericia bacterium]
MGTFLKVVGIIIIVLAVLGLILSIFSGNFIGDLTESLEYYNSDVYNTLNPVVSIVQSGLIVISAIFSFFIITIGISIYVLGAIYNDIKDLKKKISSFEIASSEKID